ncbi:MAG: ABC transporter permease [Acetatifactor sp.]|nr:ABC transporter permease [Acetatifactor sp.]
MKKLLAVLRFELDNYFKAKTFIVSTVILCLLSVGIMFIPRVIDTFKSDGNDNNVIEGEVTGDITDDTSSDNGDYTIYGICGDLDDINLDDLRQYFSWARFQVFDSVQDMKADIALGDEATCEAGFEVISPEEFTYYVYNKSMYDDVEYTFSNYLLMQGKLKYCVENGLDMEEFMSVETRQISANEEILGKDSASNYWYCYMLVIIIFMLIIMYGMQIASSVTNEKSNRSIEILVTSTSSTAILFGKVFAGVITSVFQAGTVGLSLLGSYQLNKDYWGGGLSMLLDIPAEVLITFAVFGIGGFLLYAFLYGALGALVSKIEDLNKTAGTAQMIIMLVYFMVLFNLTNVDGIVIKICSYLPISSYSAMFARVAMGTVETWEVVVSAVLLYASVIGMGFVGGKIFRDSTLRYGQPIKFSNALKSLKK